MKGKIDSAPSIRGAKERDILDVPGVETVNGHEIKLNFKMKRENKFV